MSRQRKSPTQICIDSELIASILESIHYKPETGEFFRKKSCKGRSESDKVGFIERNGYVRLTVNAKRYSGHRLAWLLTHGAWPKEQIDHINGVRNDNRICNLREVTAFQNQMNRGAAVNNKSGFRGVHFDKERKRWVSSISAYNKKIKIGTYDKIEDAIAAYKAAAEKLHGEYNPVVCK